MPKKRCFVLMAFTEENHLNNFFHKKLKPFLEESDYRCDRADISEGQNLDRRIIAGIYNADLIIADLTGKNCNVFYELGISHTIPKKTLMISQSVENLPFNINNYNVLKYNPTDFDKLKFKTEIGKTLSAVESNPITDYSPPVEKPILCNFAIKRLKDIYNDSPKKVIFIDLDGTLFNSSEHRTLASQKAFQVIFKNKKEDELQKLYKSIYEAHDTYKDIVKKDFRYNWRTQDIYRIAYLKWERGIELRNPHEYLTYCLNEINAETLGTIEKAYDVFMNEPFCPSPYAKQFLEGLEEVGFKLILVTEGEREVQIWKLEELGPDRFFSEKYVGTPYENLLNLKSYMEYLRASGKDITNHEIIYQEFKKMHDEYKNNFHASTLGDVLKNFQRINLAVIGDRYDVDLKPYEKIDGNNILRLAVTQDSIYKEETEREIKELEKKLIKGEVANVRPPKIVNDLSEAMELLVDPEIWKELEPIKNVPPIPKYNEDVKKREQKIVNARDKILEDNPSDPFILYTHEILKYFKERLL